MLLLHTYCQAEVQSKSSPTLNSKSKLKTPNSNSRLDWRDTIIEQTTHHPTHPPAILKALPEVPIQSVIPFWKPLMTLYKNCNSVAKFVQIFCNPIFQTYKKKRKKEKKEKRKSSQLIFRLTPSTPVQLLNKDNTLSTFPPANIAN